MTTTFGFQPGDILADKYEIINFIGGGYEGQVFRIRELKTKIERAAKIFYPERNVRNRTVTTYAKKLHKLRNCPSLIQYHNIEKIEHEGKSLTVFISEYVEGQMLTNFLKGYRGKRLPIYQGLHLLYALTLSIESIHAAGEYHGDLHAGNVIIRHANYKFDIILLDLFHFGKSSKVNLQNDIIEIIKIFYDVIGGQKMYAKHPRFVKSICCGLKRTLILKKFRTASQLRKYLESNDWV